MEDPLFERTKDRASDEGYLVTISMMHDIHHAKSPLTN